MQCTVDRVSELSAFYDMQELVILKPRDSLNVFHYYGSCYQMVYVCYYGTLSFAYYPGFVVENGLIIDKYVGVNGSIGLGKFVVYQLSGPDCFRFIRFLPRFLLPLLGTSGRSLVGTRRARRRGCNIV